MDLPDQDSSTSLEDVPPYHHQYLHRCNLHPENDDDLLSPAPGRRGDEKDALRKLDPLYGREGVHSLVVFDGTTYLILSPLELIEKLAALVPPPRVNLVRYHGVLAPHAKDRDKIVPKKPNEEELLKTRGLSKNRLLWSALLARTFGVNTETCPKCGGRMRIVAALTDSASVRRYLEGVGLSAETPTLAPARAPLQMEFDYEY